RPPRAASSRRAGSAGAASHRRRADPSVTRCGPSDEPRWTVESVAHYGPRGERTGGHAVTPSSDSLVNTNLPLRVLQVGAGGMGRTWLRTLLSHDRVELVGLADLDVARAKAALDETGAPDVPTARTLE